MDAIWKNRLQEYCQKQKISLPSYRIKRQSGPPHILKFQVEVEIGGHWYDGEDLCSSKKEAEQSAAKKAWDALHSENIQSASVPQTSVAQPSEDYVDPPPAYSEVVQTNPINPSPNVDPGIKKFIANLVKTSSGRIRKISPPDPQGRLKFEISGPYRYCENVRRHHRKNQIYFIVDPIKRTYFQRCHDPECFGFRSALKNIVINQTTCPDSQENNTESKCSHCDKRLMPRDRNECERCGEDFCNNCAYSCELCHDAIHCERCIELCSDCHDL